MSYAMSAALQEAVFDALQADADLSAAVGGAIYDAVPPGTLPQLYVTLGPESVQVEDDKTGSGAAHAFVVSVVTDAPGFSAAKAAAGRVCDVLHDAPLTLSRGRLVSLRFRTAKAAKVDKGTGRKIDLTFRARVEDD